MNTDNTDIGADETSKPNSLDNVSGKLNEIIAQTRAFKEQFDKYKTFNISQQVMGKERGVCTICGFCPDALLQELEAVREALPNDLKPRKGKGTDAK